MNDGGSNFSDNKEDFGFVGEEENCGIKSFIGYKAIVDSKSGYIADTIDVSDDEVSGEGDDPFCYIFVIIFVAR
ncbi:unnamed protein product [Cunninghamella echinulata]